MSSITAGGILTPQEYLTQLASASEGLWLRNYCAVAGLALMYHGYCLSFTREVNLVWMRRWRWTSLFYVMTRYFSLLSTTFAFLYGIAVFKMKCEDNYITSQFLSALGHIGLTGMIIAVVFPIIRQKSWWLGAILLTGFVQQILQVFYFKLAPCDKINILFIGALFQRQSNLRVFMEIASLIFEWIVFGVVVCHTWSLYYETINRKTNDTSLVRLLTESGLLRIGIVWLLTVTNGILWKTLSPNILGLLDYIRSAISLVFVCDWYLDFCEIQSRLTLPAFEPNFTTQPGTILGSQDTERADVTSCKGYHEENEAFYTGIARSSNWDIESQVLSYTDRGDGKWVLDRRQKRMRDIIRFRS